MTDLRAPVISIEPNACGVDSSASVNSKDSDFPAPVRSDTSFRAMPLRHRSLGLNNLQLSQLTLKTGSGVSVLSTGSFTVESTVSFLEGDLQRNKFFNGEHRRTLASAFACAVELNFGDEKGPEEKNINMKAAKDRVHLDSTEVKRWSPDQVGDFLRSLYAVPDCIHIKFIDAGVNGCKLLEMDEKTLINRWESIDENRLDTIMCAVEHLTIGRLAYTIHMDLLTLAAEAQEKVNLDTPGYEVAPEVATHLQKLDKDHFSQDALAITEEIVDLMNAVCAHPATSGNIALLRKEIDSASKELIGAAFAFDSQSIMDNSDDIMLQCSNLAQRVKQFACLTLPASERRTVTLTLPYDGASIGLALKDDPEREGPLIVQVREGSIVAGSGNIHAGSEVLAVNGHLLCGLPVSLAGEILSTVPAGKVEITLRPDSNSDSDQTIPSIG
eukprot:Clim_evm50s55 gene=Clim_evmTU50s55